MGDETLEITELLVKQMLEVDKITTGYATEDVLRDVSFDAAEGMVLALIGPNGSGKTTFIRAASGVLPLRSGSIRVGGRDITKLTNQERARLIAVVPQVRSLPPAFTTQEVVALGRTPYLNWLGKISEKDQEIIDQALEQTNLTDLADRNVYELSGGEQQRLFLARALAQEAPLLLLDEPTTHLDLKYQVNFMRLIYRLAHPLDSESAPGVKNRTVVIAIHDLNLLSRYADMVGLLVDGRLVELATPQVILNSALLSRAYSLPLHVIRDSETGMSVVAPADDPHEL